MPAAFSIDLIDPEDHKPHFSGARRLLNVEKLVFQVPQDSHSFDDHFVVRIIAQKEAVAPDPSRPQVPVLYNIVLAGNFKGVPLECIPHALWIAILLITVSALSRNWMHISLFRVLLPSWKRRFDLDR